MYYSAQALGAGWIALAKRAQYVVSVALTDTKQQAIDYFAQRFPKTQLQAAALSHELADLVALACGDIERYPHPFLAAGTGFQQAVWQGLLAIPRGETRSYQQLATMIGRPNSTRAVGSGCGANPLAVIIPCHRVTRADGQLGGFYWGLAWKRFLLAQEATGSFDK